MDANAPEGTPRLRLSSRSEHTYSSAVRDLMARAVGADVLSLAGGRPAVESFPVDRIAETFDEVLGDLGAASLQYDLTEGVGPLRELVAARSTALLGRDFTARDVLILSGSQQGLDLAARVLLDPGDVVVIDDPAYLGALLVFRPYGAEIVGIPVDGEGLCTDVLESRLRDGLRPRICYHNPNFHNPTGAVTTPERRAHLAALADQYGFVVIEDDPYGDLWFEEPPPPPIATASDLVLKLATSSKALAPGLRVAWCVGPADVVAAMGVAKHGVDLQSGTLVQHVVARLLADEAWMASHLDKVRGIYGGRARALVEALGEAMPTLDLPLPKGGMFLWAPIGAGEPPISPRDLLSAALDEGVAYVPGPEFAVDTPADEWARFSFATLPVERFAEAAQRVARAVKRLS